MATQQGHSSHGSLKSYIIGFILSIVLTIIPYMVVKDHVAAPDTIALIIAIFAVLQLLVQLKFFLHLSTKGEELANLLSFVFIFIVVGILVIGSLWIMWHMNYNMRM